MDRVARCTTLSPDTRDEDGVVSMDEVADNVGVSGEASEFDWLGNAATGLQPATNAAFEATLAAAPPHIAAVAAAEAVVVAGSKFKSEAAMV